ncbi:SRPBCC domain-containing protein [Peribacillus frigoritolerans]|uniref:SRPBCC family protein n=1 Tax=Peribacillus frigoritolerans TaxID=450367 RepID=UPI0012E2775F|nr:SRPBCC domain-containing protein [Peribacillus frigoritolerans]MCY9141039.1 SRPBCC domain-containing protein [Peribacillus frigoritolerans]MDM5312188.1 SRPBCC domain-containing protein [Peribacillus frigoritolerans]USK83091.1 SRPBCC domain-containing protein [Peribacillus frigoritolerans]UZD49580.1 SRPBCC domain-containing protein [Peribacillus frigoritolerans]WHX64650.1 SRPBCC domain-containing protein [Peribacillus frigoritolerans]
MSMENTLQDIKKTIILEAPIQKVWDTVSTAEGIASWFMPNDFQPKVGHEFHVQSPFGPSPCKVTELDAPHRLSFSWDTDGWFISFLLKEVDGKTEFTLIHGGWKEPDTILTKPNEKSSVIRDRMNHGWEQIVNQGLKKAVEG